MGVPDADGVTLRDTLLSVERQTGRRDSRLDTTPIPEAGGWHWWVFWDVNKMRTYGDYGPKKISIHDLEAWMRLNNEELSRFDVHRVMEMDIAYLNAVTKAKAKD